MSATVFDPAQQEHPLVYPVAEAGRLLGIGTSKAHILRLVRKGVLPQPFSIAGKLVFAAVDLQLVVDRGREGAAEAAEKRRQQTLRAVQGRMARRAARAAAGIPDPGLKAISEKRRAAASPCGSEAGSAPPEISGGEHA